MTFMLATNEEETSQSRQMRWTTERNEHCRHFLPQYGTWLLITLSTKSCRVGCETLRMRLRIAYTRQIGQSSLVRTKRRGEGVRTELLYCTINSTRCVLRFVSFCKICTKLIVEKKLRHE